MQKLDAIMVGLGHSMIGDHMPALLRSKDINIVGACDPSASARKQFLRLFPELENVPITGKLVDLLKEVHPTIAIVAVPHDRYLKIIFTLCRKNIYIFKEKPLALNIVEAREILSIPGFKDLGFIATQRRYSVIHQKLKQLIPKVGVPYLVHSVYKLNIKSPDKGWYGNKQRAGGGSLSNMGYHLTDLLLWWFGMPQIIHARISCLAVQGSKYDAEDSATVSFGYSNGLHGVLVISRSAGKRLEEYEIYGSKGYIMATKESVSLYDRQDRILETLKITDKEKMLDSQLAFFVDRVKKNKGFADLQSEHLANMKFIDRCYQDAANSGRS